MAICGLCSSCSVNFPDIPQVCAPGAGYEPSIAAMPQSAFSLELLEAPGQKVVLRRLCSHTLRGRNWKIGASAHCSHHAGLLIFYAY